MKCSPPRVGLGAVKFGLKVGDAMDPTPGWDFNQDGDWKRAEEYMDKNDPYARGPLKNKGSSK